jgi:hypothetical protein
VIGILFLSQAIFLKIKREYDENSYLSNIVFYGTIYGLGSLIWSFVILYKYIYEK